MSLNKFKKNLLIYKEYLDRNKTQKNPINFGEFLYSLDKDYTGLIFFEQEKDTIGKSGGNPTWGYLYEFFGEEEKEENKLKGLGDVIYKEHDYDYPNDAYNEKIFSILSQKVIKNCRVPQTDVAFLKNSNEPTIISYCIFDKDNEEMFEIKDFLYNKFERDELQQKQDIILIKDILECIKMSVLDEENYKEIEEAVVQVLALDSITNNPERHPNNWSIVREIKTGRYSLGIFDNCRAFYNMTKKYNNKQWVEGYVLTQERKKNGLGDDGEKVLKYLKDNYTEYFNKFIHRFIHKLPEFYQEIQDCPSCIDIRYLKKCLEEKVRYIYKMYDVEKGENDGEDR